MADITPATRIEKAISDASEITPATRIEKFIANISGADYELTPATRIEKLLDDAAGSSGSGEWTTDGIANNSEPSGDLIINSSSINNGAFNYKSNITSVYSDTVLTVQNNAFSHCSGIRSVKLFNATQASSSSSSIFTSCTNLEQLIIPKWSGTLNSFVSSCTKLKTLDIGDHVVFGSTACATTTLLETVILRSTTLCTITASTAFNLSSVSGSTTGIIPEIYVPAALLENYKTANYWKNYFDLGIISFLTIEGSTYENYYADGTPVT